MFAVLAGFGAGTSSCLFVFLFHLVGAIACAVDFRSFFLSERTVAVGAGPVSGGSVCDCFFSAGGVGALIA